MKKPVAWMASNHVAANLLMVFVLLTGALGIAGMKIETFPEIELDTVQIQVPYLGASPEDVEERGLPSHRRAPRGYGRRAQDSINGK